MDMKAFRFILIVILATMLLFSGCATLTQGKDAENPYNVFPGGRRGVHQRRTERGDPTPGQNPQKPDWGHPDRIPWI